jgi:uncharacterized alkaline shock family protein YloU
MDEKLGKVVIAPAVLTTIVRLTALAQLGVRRMGSTPAPMERMLDWSSTSKGVRLQISEESVAVDLYIIADASANMRELGETLQSEITRSIHNMVGMSVRQVNVHIDGIEFTAAVEPAPRPVAPLLRDRRPGHSVE